RGMEMLRRVFVFRRITTANVPALETQPQMYPGIAHFQALFAAPRMRLRFLHVLDVLASFAHAWAFSLSAGCCMAGCLKGSRIVKLVWPGCDSTSIKP